MDVKDGMFWFGLLPLGIAASVLVVAFICFTFSLIREALRKK